MYKSFLTIDSIERERASVPADSPQCLECDFSNISFHQCCHFCVSKTNIWNLGEFYYDMFIDKNLIWNLWELHEILHLQKNPKISPNPTACYRLVKRKSHRLHYMQPTSWPTWLYPSWISINKVEISIIINSTTSDFG